MAKKSATEAAADQTAMQLAKQTVGAGAMVNVPKLDVSNYAIVSMAALGDGSISEALRENLGGGTIGAFDFQRCKVPSGEGLAWTTVDADTGEEKSENAIEGIIVAFKDQKAFWKKNLSEAGAKAGPPDCYSTDLVKGRGDPGIACAECHFNTFGSAKNDTGAGKACKDVRLIFLNRPGDMLPELVPIPPTSIKGAKAYFLRLASRGIPYWRAVTRLGLTREKNSNDIKYARVTFELVGVLPEENVGTVREYAGVVKEMLGMSVVQVRHSDFQNDEPAARGNGAAETVEGEVDADRSDLV